MGDEPVVTEAAERRYAFLRRWMPLLAPAFFAPMAVVPVLVGVPAPWALAVWLLLTSGFLVMFYAPPPRRDRPKP